MILAAAAFLIVWLGLAVWARRKMHLSAGAPALPTWLGRTLVAAGVVYVLLVLLFTIG